ncbi:PAS domain-containing protein [Bauldia sp.]|uniref:PAS domain-containing protein n=1 Tax=Bauldia sp. TaxID=2575872 RepID=UPI003BA99990
MNVQELEAFRHVPFLLWVKDEDGRYIWGNNAIDEFAGEPVVGKTDADLRWADNAESLRADDKQVMATGKPMFTNEMVDDSTLGKVTLCVCKYADQLDGKTHAFGISFVVRG